jgi:hypothetical protein
MVNAFLDWAQQQPNVWIISTEQLLEWVMDPKSISKLDESEALSCSAPQLDADVRICNGMPGHMEGLLLQCPFPEYPFSTCYGQFALLSALPLGHPPVAKVALYPLCAGSRLPGRLSLTWPARPSPGPGKEQSAPLPAALELLNRILGPGRRHLPAERQD